MTAEGGDEAHARIDRLERRLARERATREQAERIAEHGMRDLWQTNRGLEERVAERTSELRHSLASATMAAEAKEAFLAELGHDLNTPLHAVLGLLELVDTSALSPDDAERMSEIRMHATTLAGLLESLVELAGAEGGSRPDDITTRSASSWTDDVVDAWSRRAAGAGQLIVPSVHGADDRPVAVDWVRLRRIVDALLDNAVRHATTGTVLLGTTVGADVVTVEVVDDGPGMTADEATTATEPFVRHGSEPDAQGGAGIGLAIAARRATAAGGSLEVVPEAGGTRVVVTLPLRIG
ncbi:MAG: sensor histidine kinase [Ilumatobacter sp.]